MGTLTLPVGGLIYVDTQSVIYTVERHPDYEPVLRPLWEAARSGTVEVVSSELTLLEALVVPLRTGNVALQMDFEDVLLRAEIALLPITQAILWEAARLRAMIAGLRTPDAIHAATALQHRCDLVITNDIGFNRFTGLAVTILDTVR